MENVFSFFQCSFCDIFLVMDREGSRLVVKPEEISVTSITAVFVCLFVCLFLATLKYDFGRKHSGL